LRLLDLIKLSLRSLGTNILRSVLTLSIIAIGIMALIGILTAIEGIKTSISSNFASLGASSFTIEKSGAGFHDDGPQRREEKEAPSITFEEAKDFKERYAFPATVSFNFTAKMFATAKYAQKKTNPNLFLQGVDENYLSTAGLELATGRFFTESEAENIFNGVVIGKSICEKLFNNEASAIDEIIEVGGKRYKVIGVLASKGSSSIFSSDNDAFISIATARFQFPNPKMSLALNVAVKDPTQLDIATSEAIGILRSVRRLSFSEADNFEISKSDKLSSLLLDQMKYVTVAATLIGLITLIGAGIGLMNIMLVSVAERTREIGICKAVGATNRIVIYQFLTEAILLCLMGGVAGILLGMLAGNAVSLALKGPFIIPWIWIFMGIFFCIFVGILAGIYPALKAARVDPIESLRFE